MSLKTSISNFEKSLKKIPSKKSSHKSTKVVSPRTFVESPKYLNAKGVLYPEVMKAFVELNSGNYYEAVLTGAIGIGKTTIAVYTLQSSLGFSVVKVTSK